MKRLTIQHMQKLASRRGGKCLSTSYVNTDTKLSWQCADGHVWENTPAHIKRGQWCPICRGVAKKTIQDMQTMAAARGGRCLSKHYINNESHLIWECAEGHTWRAKPANIKTGTWCPVCSGQHQDISDLRSLAKARGGNCLSDVYRGQARKHKWQCREGHEWDATPNSLKNGSWCPHCHIHYGEELCRLYFEAIFKTPFPRSYPIFLKIGQRRFLQLDGYSEELGIAFEHQGEQHYKQIKRFHRTEADFRRQLKRDKDKRELCQRHGVVLITIPHVPKITPLLELVQTIKTQCVRAGISIPTDTESLEVEPNRAYNVSILDALRDIAKAHGGKCLSRAYLGDRVKLRWRCAEGHEWEAMPNGIKNGTWCPYCYGNLPASIEEIRSRISLTGHHLVKRKKEGKKWVIILKCPKGHTWQTTAKAVKRAFLCPTCAADARPTIGDMRRLAAEHGGACLSSRYVNNITKLRWRCHRGHEWDAPYSSIQQGKWCQKCGIIDGANKRRDTIENLRALARSRGGECPSDGYTDSKSPLLWRCQEGHEWWALASSVRDTPKRRGSWCARCAHISRGQSQRCSIESMNTIAKKRGGRCLSKEYVTCQTHLIWECGNGHVWKATPSNIKKGRWCPTCARRKKLTLKEMQNIAAAHGGACLSKKYVNVRTKLKWCCSEGHIWEASPEMITGTPKKPGTWCPKCALLRRSRSQ